MERKIKINRLDLIKAKAQNDLIYNLSRKIYKYALSQKRHLKMLEEVKDSS